MKEQKLYKLRLTKQAKIGGRWYQSGSVVKVDKAITSDLVLNDGADFTDPDEAFTVDKSVRPVNPANPDSRRKDRDTIVAELCDIDGVSTDIAENLVDAGYTTINDVYNAEPEDLVKIKGIGNKSAPQIIESAGELVEEDDPVE